MPGYKTPITAVPGYSLPAADWNAGVRDSLEAVAKPPRARVRRTTNHAIAHNVTTQIAWDTEDYDTGLWTPGNAGNFVVPADLNGCYFRLGLCAQFAINGTGARHLSIARNGSILASFNSMGNATWFVGSVLTVDFYGLTNDTFQAYAYQSSGASLNLVIDYPLAFWICAISR